MLVKEEKILLMAKESATETDILAAIRQVVNNCVLDTDFDVDSLPIFLLELVFLRLRAFSIGDQIKVSYLDDTDKKVYDFNIKLSEVEIKYPSPVPESVIKITPTAGITMKYPKTALYNDSAFLQSAPGDDAFYNLVAKCVDKVYDGDTVYEASEFSHQELLEFVELIDIKSFDLIKAYLANLPSLYLQLKYTNAFGNEGQVTLRTLADFFTLR